MNKNLETFLVGFLCVYYSIQVFFKLFLLFVHEGFGAFRVKKQTLAPPVLRDERWGRHQFIYLKKQKIKLHYVEKGDRSNQLMLCLHGFPECWLTWRNQLEKLSPHFWVVAVDMRGFGDSDKPKEFSSYRSEHVVADIQELLFTLTEGKRKCILMGHDWGGTIAWDLVEKYPELFDHHICINGPHIETYRSLIFTHWKQFKKSWYIFYFQNRWLPEITLSMKDLKLYTANLRGSRNRIDAFPDDVIDGYRYYYTKKGAFTPPINYYRNAFAHEPVTYNERIKVPTLIIWGEDDHSMDRDIGIKSSSLCETVEFKLIKKGEHFLHAHEAETVNNLILNYLKMKKL